ncbi:cytochrome c oxidase assembly factor CtaG [Neobacillus sp. PS3-34]|uniref:cytochrome c oxidase assembly factor CtaG n=1 Tax=Neobacillus sp. PS3-34 TaxID=3070678 RepID=UPI0027DF653F|nr:cytochrome c oxidase assembly factor CtaG [Neobacillus sp. PS3-34]WML49380.1 cytochrome c oxidase assembly factor CtaG [Neobacillus sp. PS3-34]
MTLDIFGFQALWSPYFLSVLLLILVGYFLITVRYRKRFKSNEPLTVEQGILFSAGIVILYAIKGSPLDLMGHLMFYAHMIQMAVLCLVIPPIIILGLPQWVWRGVLRLPVIRTVFPIMTKPIIALIVFNGFFSVYHIPLIFDTIKQNMWLHGFYTSLLFVTAIFMWWPLVNKLSDYQTLNGLKKVGYIFADGILLTPACALIIFADTPMYATFSDPHAWGEAMKLCVPPSTLASLNLSGPELFNSMSLIHDQQLGGVLMKVIQEVVYGTILGQVFFEWYRKDQAESEQELSQDISPSAVE